MEELNECVFCRIAKNEMPSFKVIENNDAIAFLDIFPISKAQSVVIPKTHCNSSFTKCDIEIVNKTMSLAQSTAKLIEEKLHAERSFIVIQGLGVNHFHIKIYPRFKDKGEDFTTRMGERANDEELEKMVKEITT